MTVEDSYFDNCGNEIQEGDLLKIWHFRGRRRKIYYMYQIVVLQEFKGIHYWAAKMYHVSENKGHYWLRAIADKTTRVIAGTTVIDSKDAMRELRQIPLASTNKNETNESV